MGLAPSLDAVLRGQASEENTLDRIYKLVQRYEMADWDEVERLADDLGTAPELVGEAYRNALPWADEAARS
jgi:c-di-GMP-related signal transduction protein